MSNLNVLAKINWLMQIISLNLKCDQRKNTNIYKIYITCTMFHFLYLHLFQLKLSVRPSASGLSFLVQPITCSRGRGLSCSAAYLLQPVVVDNFCGNPIGTVGRRGCRSGFRPERQTESKNVTHTQINRRTHTPAPKHHVHSQNIDNLTLKIKRRRSLHFLDSPPGLR